MCFMWLGVNMGRETSSWPLLKWSLKFRGIVSGANGIWSHVSENSSS